MHFPASLAYTAQVKTQNPKASPFSVFTSLDLMEAAPAVKLLPALPVHTARAAPPAA